MITRKIFHLILICYAFVLSYQSQASEALNRDRRGIDSLLKQVFLQPADPVPSGFCSNIPFQQLPKKMTELKQLLESSTLKNVNSIRRYFFDLSKKSTDVFVDIDRHSSYYQKTQQFSNPSIFSGQERPSRFSGAGQADIKLIQEEGTRKFIEGLFNYAAKASSLWNYTQLNRADLFHGHMVYSPAESDVRIVFHAKEYVEGEPSVQKGLPRRRLLEYFGEMPGKELNLNNPTPAVTRRNFIWSLKMNRFCGLDVSQGNFAPLRELNDPQSFTLDQDKVTEIGENGEIANINYFPKEDVPIFFDFHKGS